MTTPSLTAVLAGRYTIERELGAGGMATVYLAEDVRHHRRVALKVLHPELSAVIGPERFLKEIELTANLQHPHILPLFDSGDVNGQMFYVMPYVDGETLRSRLDREKQLPIADAVRLAREVADALQYAHERGVIHRDIKPENILLQGGHALVADFGIALAVQHAGSQRMTQTGLSLGTPQYMAPEQAMGEKTVDARADIYALGAVTYEMLAGDPPFTGSTAQAIVARVLTVPPAPIAQTRGTVPLHIEQAVLTALAKLPADRFSSASAFAEALGNPAYGGTGYGVAAVTTGEARAPVRNRRRALVAVSTLAAVLLATTIWSLTRPEPRRFVSRFSIQLGDGFNDLSEVPRGNIAFSPDGRTIVYVGTSGRGGSQLFVRRLDELAGKPLVGTEGAFNPSFSPNGSQVAFVTTTPRVLKTIALEGGTPLVRADSLVDNGGVAWGSDGYIYFDSKFAGDVLARVRESGGKPEAATRIDTANGERYHYRPSALPKGRGLLFVSGRGTESDARVSVLDARTGKHKQLVNGVVAHYAESGHLVFVTADGTMMAAPFDLESLEQRGDAVPLFNAVGTSINALDVTLSPSGLLTYRAVENAAAKELAWVSRSGAIARVDSGFTGALLTAWLSPDGASALVLIGLGFFGGSDAELWLKRLDRGAKVKLAERVRSATWSPDGRRMAVADTTGIFIGPVDGSAPLTRWLTRSRVQQPHWSPDGRWILFAGRGDIMAVATSGDTVPRTVIGAPSVEAGPSLSPDGRFLAFTSDRSGRFELYVSPFPAGPQARQQQVSEGGVISNPAPRWSRDGRTLFYISEQRDLIAIPILPDKVFAFDSPRVLFPFSVGAGFTSFDVSHDGQRFLAIRTVGANAISARPLILVQNFFEELKEKVPVRR